MSETVINTERKRKFGVASWGWQNWRAIRSRRQRVARYKKNSENLKSLKRRLWHYIYIKLYDCIHVTFKNNIKMYRKKNKLNYLKKNFVLFLSKNIIYCTSLISWRSLRFIAFYYRSGGVINHFVSLPISQFYLLFKLT